MFLEQGTPAGTQRSRVIFSWFQLQLPGSQAVWDFHTWGSRKPGAGIGPGVLRTLKCKMPRGHFLKRRPAFWTQDPELQTSGEFAA